VSDVFDSLKCMLCTLKLFDVSDVFGVFDVFDDIASDVSAMSDVSDDKATPKSRILVILAILDRFSTAPCHHERVNILFHLDCHAESQPLRKKTDPRTKHSSF